MATEVDKRVVEMQFNNKDFEKNCQASLTTLEKLKMALNFDGAKGLESMGKAASKIDLSNIAKGAEAVEVKFNAMNIAGMTVVSELTKGFLNLGKTIWNMSFGQATKGGMARTLKIDQAKHQMEALANNLEEVKNGAKTVEQVMSGMLDAVDRSVTGTAYGYDAAASVASQLMASGLTDTKTMYNHLRAIAGAADMTGRSFEDIGNIFTTVASNGRLMTMQLRQFSAAGLNLSATLAQRLNKTEEEINAMVTKGQISFEQFSDALYKSFGDAAGNADKTWSGVTSNIKAQLSRIGQLFTDPFVQNMIPVLASLKMKIRELNGVIKPLSKTFETVFKSVTVRVKETLDNMSMARIRIIINGIDNIFGSLIIILDTVKKAFLEVFPKKTIDELTDAAHQFELMTRQLIPTQKTLEGLKTVLKLLLLPLRLIYNIFKALADSVIKPLMLAVSRLLAAFLRLSTALSPLVDGIVSILTGSEFLNNVFMILAATIIVVMDAVGQLVEAFGILLSQFTGTTAFQQVVKALHDLASLLMNVVLIALKTIFQIIHAIFSLINAEKIVNVANGIGAAVSFVVNLLLLGITAIASAIRAITNSGTIIGNIFKTIKEFVLLVKDLFSGNDVSGRLENIKKLIGSIGDGIDELFKKIREHLKTLNTGKIMLLAFGFAIIFLIWSIKNLTDATTGLVKGVSSSLGVFKNLKTLFGNLAQVSPAFQILIGFTAAIGMITASLVTLSNDTDPEKLKQVAIILGAFAGGLVLLALGVTFLQSKMGNTSEGFKSMIAMMVGMAGSVLVLAIAMKEISKVEMDLSKFWQPLIGVLTLMAALATAMMIMNKFAGDPKLLARTAIVMVAFALSIKILAKVLEGLASIDLASNAKNTLLALAGIMGLIVALAWAMSMIGLTGVKAGAGFAMQGFVISLLGVVLLIKILASQDYDTIYHGLIRMSMLFVPIAAFLSIAAGLSKLGGEGFFSGLAKTIMSINLCVILLIGSVAVLGSMDISILIKGLMALAVLGKILSSIIKNVVSVLNESKGDYKNVVGGLKVLDKFVKGIGVTMLMLAAAIKIIDGIPLGSVLTAVGVMAALGLLIKWTVEASEKTKDAKIGPIIAVIAAISSIMAAMAILAFHDPVNIAAAGLAIGLALSGLALVLKFVNKAPTSKIDKKNEKELAKARNNTALMAAAIGGIILAITAMAHIATKMTPTSINAMGMMLGALAGIMVMLGVFIAATARIENDKYASNAKSVSILIAGVCGAVILMAAAIAGLAVVSTMLGENGWVNVITATAAIMLCIGSIEEALETLQKVEHDARDKNSLMKFAQTFVITCSGLAIIAAALAGLATVTAKVSGFGSLMGSVLAIGLLAATVVGVMFGMMKVEEIRNKNGMQAGSKAAKGKGQDINKTGRGTLQQIAQTIVIACSSFAVIAGALAGLAVVSKIAGFGNVMGSVLAIGLLAAEVTGMFWVIIREGKNFDKSQLKNIATSFVIMASALAIIAAAVAGLSIVTALSNPAATWSAVGSLISIALALFGGMAGVLAVAIKVPTDSINQLSYLVLYFGLAVGLIAGSIFMLSEINPKNEKAFVKSINMLKKIVGLITTTISIIAVLVVAFEATKKWTGADKIDTSIFWTLAVVFAAMAASTVAIAASLAILMNSMKDVDENKVKKACNTLMVILGIFAGLSLTIGLLSAIPGVSNIIQAIVMAMLGFAGAVAIFSAAGLMVAKTVETMINSFEKLNNVNFNSKRISDNLSSVLDVLRTAIPELIDVIYENITGIVAGAVKMGVSFIVGFLQGIRDSIGDILDTVADIMREIVDFLQTPGVMDLFRELAKSIGSVIVEVLIGLIEGIYDQLSALAESLFDKLDNWLRKIHLEEGKIESRYNNITAHMNPFDIQNDRWMDAMEKGFNVNEKGIINLNLDNFGSDALNAISEMKEYYERDHYAAKELYEAVRDRAITQMKLTAALGQGDASGADYVEGYVQLAKAYGLSDVYVRQLTNDISGLNYTLDENGEVIETNSVKTEEYNSAVNNSTQTLTKNTEEATKSVESQSKAVDEMVNNLKESGSEAGNVFSNIIDGFGGSEGFVASIYSSAKEGGSKLKDIFVDLFTGLGALSGKKFDASMLQSIDFGSLAKGIASGSVDITDIMGIIGGVAGGEYGSYFEKELDYYVKEGLEDVVDEAGNQLKRWESILDDEGNRKYQDVYAYAQARKDEEDSLSGMNKLLKDFFGIQEDVNEATETGINNTEKLSESMGGLSKSTIKAVKTFKEFYTSLHDSMESALKSIYDEYKEDDPIGTDEMLKRMEANTKKVGKWARQLQELAAKGMSEGLLNELKDMGPQAADKVDAFARMTTEQLERANQTFAAKTKLPDYATDNIVASYEQAGYNASLGFANGVDPQVVKDTFFNLGEEGLAELEKSLDEHSPSKETEKRGVWAIQGFDQGLKNPVIKLLIMKDIDILSNQILSRFRTNLSQQKMYTIASYMFSGLAQGFTSSPTISSTLKSATSAAGRILSAFTTHWQVHSPSKVMEEIGGYLMQGLGIGITDGSTLVERETGSTADDILTAMKDNLYGKLEGLGEDGVYQPVIRPVFDLEALQSGYLGIQDYLNTLGPMGAVDISGNLTRLTGASRDDGNLTEQEILNAVRGIDVDSIRSEMQGLRTDISNLQTAMSGMQVVMNTGALVGQLVDPIDNALGSKALLNGRGRY